MEKSFKLKLVGFKTLPLISQSFVAFEECSVLGTQVGDIGNEVTFLLGQLEDLGVQVGDFWLQPVLAVDPEVVEGNLDLVSLRGDLGQGDFELAVDSVVGSFEKSGEFINSGPKIKILSSDGSDILLKSEVVVVEKLILVAESSNVTPQSSILRHGVGVDEAESLGLVDERSIISETAIPEAGSGHEVSVSASVSSKGTIGGWDDGAETGAEGSDWESVPSCEVTVRHW